MKMTMIRTLVAAITCAWPAFGWAHGTPIVVSAASGQLTIGNGLAGGGGYASRIFADTDPQSRLSPGTPTEQFTSLPSFQISGVNVGEPISMEVISRPDLSAPGHPQRWLWHWNLATQRVATAPNDPYVDVVSSRGLAPPNVFLTQSAAPLNSSVKLADVLSTDLGTHQHMLTYFLDDSPAAPAGVYGFFARLTAPGYQSSDPFLIALNLNVNNATLYQAGAIEMNLTAGLAGDYDVDEDVDGRDLLAWQRQVGMAGIYRPADGSLNGVVDSADLAIWKSQFGRVATVPNAVAAATAIPEPATLSLAVGAIFLAAIGRRFKTGG